MSRPRKPGDDPPGGDSGGDPPGGSLPYGGGDTPRDAPAYPPGEGDGSGSFAADVSGEAGGLPPGGEPFGDPGAFIPDAAIGSEHTSNAGERAVSSDILSDIQIGKDLDMGTTGFFIPPALMFVDLDEREQQQIATLENEKYQLQQQYGEDPPKEVQDRIDQIVDMLAADQENVDPLPWNCHTGGTFPIGSPSDSLPIPVDPLFRRLGETLKTIGYEGDARHLHGFLPSQFERQVPSFELEPDELALAAVFGLLLADNLRVPGRAFATDVATRLGEYTAEGKKGVFDRTLIVLGNEGTACRRRNVSAQQWVSVARALVARGINEFDAQLDAKIRIELAAQLAANENAAPSSVAIDLPDLEAQADVEIVADNVRAMQAVHFTAMLEEMKLFQVVDKLVELFQNGLLPFGRGRAGDLLFAYWKKSANRLSEVERRNLYARGLGLPGGDAGITNPNRDQADLFMRFASAVSQYVRQFTVDDLLRSNIPFRVNEEAVRKAGRDLAANLSLHGYGIAHFAAAELQAQLNEIIAILGDAEVKNAYGARDMWQVVDQVATLELGGAKNGVRYRTMATAGAIVIRWLAEHAAVLAAGYGTPLLNMAEIRRPTPRPAGQKPTTHPTDRDLVDAVEQWLAVTGTPDARVEEYSQPVEGPATTSRPIAIPQVARDLLDSVGVSAGYTGNGGGGRLASYGVR